MTGDATERGTARAFLLRFAAVLDLWRQSSREVACLEDVTLSPGAVAAVTALLGGLVAAIGVLFFQLIASKNAQIAREQELTNRLLPAVEEGNRTLQRLVELIQALQRDLITWRRPVE